jgi:hypothetical protein
MRLAGCAVRHPKPLDICGFKKISYGKNTLLSQGLLAWLNDISAEFSYIPKYIDRQLAYQS